MPWQLTTPVPVGGLDTANYDQIRITRFDNDSVRLRMLIELEYGRTVNGTWVKGFTPVGKHTSVMIEGADYSAFVATATPAEGETTYEAVKRNLYEWLVAHSIIEAGAVV